MAGISHGTVTVDIPDQLDPDERAGNLSKDDIKRIPKAPRGLGLVCDSTAEAMSKAGAKFAPPPGITPEGLRLAGSKAEDIDQVILDLEVVLNTLKQANLLFDADAWDQLRQMNDQVKAQAKRNPELLQMFKPLVDFFARGRRGGGSGGGSQG